jgi:hypothetical protein
VTTPTQHKANPPLVLQPPPKRQWGTPLSTVCAMLLVILFLFQIHSNQQAAVQGEIAFAGLCGLKNSIIVDRDDGLAFLQMSQAEKKEKFGPALAGIPEETIIKSVADQTKRIAALRQLDCPSPYADGKETP